MGEIFSELGRILENTSPSVISGPAYELALLFSVEFTELFGDWPLA
jgi:hypothetical protein